MSYKNDSLLTIVNKYSSSSSDAKALLYETYDKLRDLTVSGSSISGGGMGSASSALIKFAQLFSPSSYMPVYGNSMNIPGTSYSSSISGGNSIVSGGMASMGYQTLGSYSGYPTGGAVSGLDGEVTGYAASLAATGTGALAGTTTGLLSKTQSFVLPVAGFLSGVGGIASSIAPYFGAWGALGGVAGEVVQGFAGALLGGYQNINNRVINNADVILQNKVKNIETVCKQLDTQSDVLRKMLKDSIESDSKAIQDL